MHSLLKKKQKKMKQDKKYRLNTYTRILHITAIQQKNHVHNPSKQNRLKSILAYLFLVFLFEQKIYFAYYHHHTQKLCTKTSNVCCTLLLNKKSFSRAFTFIPSCTSTYATYLSVCKVYTADCVSLLHFSKYRTKQREREKGKLSPFICLRVLCVLYLLGFFSMDQFRFLILLPYMPGSGKGRKKYYIPSHVTKLQKKPVHFFPFSVKE